MQCDAFVVTVLSDEPKQNQRRGLVDRKLVKTPSVILLLAVPHQLFCFGSLVILYVVCCIYCYSCYIRETGRIDVKEEVRNPSETDSIKSQSSSKTPSGKKDSTKRRH